MEVCWQYLCLMYIRAAHMNDGYASLLKIYIVITSDSCFISPAGRSGDSQCQTNKKGAKNVRDLGPK